MQSKSVAKEGSPYLLHELLEGVNKQHPVTGSLEPSRSSVSDNINDNSAF